ncbi:efflux RND transporter permease subunit [Halioxenophilus aromaticivorans]|uniref:CusA/CzcA family heavy metal efflux RND transporter n=1 Tax=Halioxenophilus aromaticivorans TaxID=1306992 RepID=A0AAV3TZR4_9ALTE
MIHSIIQFSIQQRLVVSLLCLFIVAIGVWHFNRLPIDAVPDITNVQVQINTQAPGYTPLETEQRITYPIETALYGLAHLDYTRSLSRYGLSQVTVIFEDGTDLYFARNLISQRLASIGQKLPGRIEPELGPVSTGLGEVLMYTVQANAEARQDNGQPFDETALREIQDWIIKPQLAQVKGVVEVNSIGGFEKQFHVLPKPALLLQYQLSLGDIAQALAQANQNIGAGFIERNGQQLLVRSEGQINHIEQLEHLSIKTPNGAHITLKDIAEVAIGKNLRSGAATQNGQETVLGTVMMLIGDNSRSVALASTEKLAQINTTLPKGVTATPVYTRTTLVEKAVATVSKNLLEGALLVVAVLMLLLGNLRAALITAAIIPLSMLMTITGMVKTGVSANLMSLGALDFGLIVDGAVIVVDNAVKRLAQAQHKQALPPLNARLSTVFKATGEVIKPSLFGVLIITLVYLPIFSLTGVEGKMFHPMAATVVMALLSALLLTMTFVPAAVALFMRGPISQQESRIIAACKRVYLPVLETALAYKAWILPSAALWLAFSAWLATTLGSEFIPQLNEGDIALHALRSPGTGIEQSVAMQKSLEQIIIGFPQVERVFARIGTAEVATDPMPPNVADNFIILKPRQQWPNPDLSKTDLVAQMETAVGQVPGNNYEFTQPIQMRFNELISGVRADLGIKLYGDDLATLQNYGQKILGVVNSLPGAADARLEQTTGLPTLSITPKREALSRFGLTVAQLQHWLASTLAGADAGVVYQGDRRFELLVRLPENLRQDIRSWGSLPVPIDLPNAQFVPLEEIATVTLADGPAQISRENGKRRLVITSNIRGQDLATFVQQAQTEINKQVSLPPGYWLEYGGSFEQLVSASKRLSLVIPATLLLVFAALIIALGAVREAAMVFVGVPMALTGGVVALAVRDMPLSISAAVGFIALCGIAVLNGLVLVEFIKHNVQRQADLRGAVVEAALGRLRPVLMTALVASLGFVPMALNTGIGAEVQRPLATVVIGGIISSTALTLVLLPMLYVMFGQPSSADGKPAASNH